METIQVIKNAAINSMVMSGILLPIRSIQPRNPPTFWGCTVSGVVFGIEISTPSCLLDIHRWGAAAMLYIYDRNQRLQYTMSYIIRQMYEA